MNTSIITKHTCNNGDGPTFGKKTAGCPRCDELIAGAAPRAWNGSDTKAYNDRVDRAYRASQKCVGHSPEYNPGGYCTVCGKGGDNS